MSPILRFYRGEGTDAVGRTLAQVQALDHRQMEYIHDFIQWMFPLQEPSQHNPDAPILTLDDIQAFHDDPALRASLSRSFALFLDFLGLEFADGEVRPVPGRPPRPPVLATPNHNWLRITRVLLCLKTLGLDGECLAFFGYLKTAYESGIGVNDRTFAYWESAARGEAC